MKFTGEPNLYVRISNKFIHRATGKKGFAFDENGQYETENELLIKVLKQSFPIVEEPIEQPKKTFKCKQCDFETTESMGVLLAHYREAHPKK
jgi:hypothetical protein